MVDESDPSEPPDSRDDADAESDAAPGEDVPPDRDPDRVATPEGDPAGDAEDANASGEGTDETGAEPDGAGIDASHMIDEEVMRQPDYDDLKPASEYIEEERGPDADAEMPLTAHIEEMLKRLMVVIAVAGVVSVATYPFTEEIINFLWNSILGGSTRPHLYGVLELLFTKLKVASLAGVILGLPVVVYEAYQFMRPGLYPHERRYYLAAVPTSLVLALLGVSFAYFVVLPALFEYFLAYTKPVVSGTGAGAAAGATAGIGLALGRTFDLILVLMGYLAIVFQIPLMIMLAMMMGVVTRQWLADRRLLFWGGFLGVSFLLFGPADPTGASPILVSITMILLFEGTLFLVKWTRRARR